VDGEREGESEGEKVREKEKGRGGRGDRGETGGEVKRKISKSDEVERVTV
jgi:hypothetical protein